jgi:hypothetical protein
LEKSEQISKSIIGNAGNRNEGSLCKKTKKPLPDRCKKKFQNLDAKQGLSVISPIVKLNGRELAPFSNKP